MLDTVLTSLFLTATLKWSKVKVPQSCPTLCDPMDYAVYGMLLAQSTGVGSLSLLQRIFPTQESNRGLQHFRWILFQLSYQLDVNVILHLIIAQTEAQRFSSMLKGHKTSKWRRRM